ncbi:MAG TPA: hypothetical protein PK185_09115 [Cyclobacteriaceae bacterium]|nr:hypothetical protein [Cyclobacteriaceae bacterium]
MKLLNYTAFILLLSLSVSCQNSVKKEVDSPPEVNSSNENKQIENKTDISFLIGKRFQALFITPSSNISRYIEPACLSDGPSLSFEEDEVIFRCGQDAISHMIHSSIKKGNDYSLRLDKNLVLTLEYIESEPFDFITIKLSDMNELFMGYYPDSIISTNSDSIQMALWTNDTRGKLEREARYTALECPDDTFD